MLSFTFKIWKIDISNGKPRLILNFINFKISLISLIDILKPCPAKGCNLCKVSPNAKIFLDNMILNLMILIQI